VLRGARLSARLSQTDLARRAGVPQSVVSAYENGRREPSLSTLRRLVESTGNHSTFVSCRAGRSDCQTRSGVGCFAAGGRPREPSRPGMERPACVCSARSHGEMIVRQ